MPAVVYDLMHRPTNKTMVKGDKDNELFCVGGEETLILSNFDFSYLAEV